MGTHPAVVMVGLGQPLELRQLPTVKPTGNQVRLRVEWTASTPFDLHQADGGLNVNHPQAIGDGVAGTIVEIGPSVSQFKIGDVVFGFTWRNQAEKAHQMYCTAPENLLGKLPPGFTMQQAVVLGNNFVTAWHGLTKDFGFELPWPKPDGYVPPRSQEWILIWGGSSSCGQYMLQLLKWYGYKNLITTASKAHHRKLKGYGAVECFDYREEDVVQRILEFVRVKQQSGGGSLAFIMDCIGSQSGSVKPIARIAEKGSKVAILLPVIVRDAADGVAPIYEMDVEGAAKWAKGVEVAGVRTHFYLDNQFLADRLQSDIMPAVLQQGIVEPNDQFIVEGETMLERAEKAMSMLRRKEVSGERLVWRVADE